MVTGLYLVSLTILLVFLVLTIEEKIRTAFHKNKLHLNTDSRPTEVAENKMIVE